MKNLTELDYLIMDNMGLIKSVIRLFRPKNKQRFEELLQYGMIGFWKAVKNHNPNRSKFCTTAYNYIKYEILENIRAEKRQALNNKVALYKYAQSNTQNDNELFDECIPINSLSKREVDILDMLRLGYSKNHIAKSIKDNKLSLNKQIDIIFEKIRASNV